MNKFFPVIIHYGNYLKPELAIYRHWHPQMEIILVEEGGGSFECDSLTFDVSAGDVVVVNSNQLHWCFCNRAPFFYYYIIIDTSFLKGENEGICEQKYITPIFNETILFENHIHASSAMSDCLHKLISEYAKKEIGYELYVKSLVYELFCLLLRNHVDRMLTKKEQETRIGNVDRFQKVYEYIEKNYSDNIMVSKLSSILCVSDCYFYHLFKKITGKTLGEYICRIRIDKAEQMLINTDLSVTNIAITTGFSDSNYFCRVFRKYKQFSPSEFRYLHRV